MQVKSLRTVAQVIPLLLASLSAQATSPGALGAIDNTPFVVGNSVPAGLLFDVYHFSLLNPGWLSGVASALNLAPALGLSNFSAVLQDSSAMVLGTDLNPADGFSFAGLGAGSYALTFVGFATGTAGGSYGGSIYAATAAIPEPESYVLMLAGLAVVGLIVGRRQPPA